MAKSKSDGDAPGTKEEPETSAKVKDGVEDEAEEEEEEEEEEPVDDPEVDFEVTGASKIDGP